ncbi:hypothetical protein L195_g036075, partial [Trifolium pratense]
MTMFELHVSENPFGTVNVESHVDTAVKPAIKPNAESSGKASSEIEKPDIEKFVEEPLISNKLNTNETLDESRTNVDAIDGQSSMSIPLDVPVGAFDKAIPEIVDKSVKEKPGVPDAAQDVKAPDDPTDAEKDVEASKELSNPNAATATESFGSSSESETSTEEEVNKSGGTPEAVADSEPEKDEEKYVSGDDDVTKSEKTAPEGQNLVDLDNIETDQDPQPKHVESGPIKYGAKKGWSKVVPPFEKKKNVLKRKSAPSSDSDF